jgi:hypothetical protein
MKRLFLTLLLLLTLLILPVSADTLLVYNLHDGQLGQTAVSEDFSILNTGAGNYNADNLSGTYIPDIRMHASTSGKFTRVYKYMSGYDTSAIGTGTINSAKNRIKIVGRTLTTGGTNETAIVAGSPLNILDYVDSDYARFGTTEFASRVDYTSIADGGNMNFTLNAAGIAYINKTGITTFGFMDGDSLDGTFSGSWVAGGIRRVQIYPAVASTSTNRPYMEIIYTPYSADTTPPASITGLSNTSTNCNNITWQWTNPTDADYSHLWTLQNNTWIANYSNSTTTALWTGLPENTDMTFSGRTVDLTGNMNTTWTNLTARTGICATPTPTPTPTTTATTVPPTTAPPSYAGCNWTNLTGTIISPNSTSWEASINITRWGVLITNQTYGNVSWYRCIDTYVTTAITTQPWYPEINPTTDTKMDWWQLITQWWWIPALLIAVFLIISGRR